MEFDGILGFGRKSDGERVEKMRIGPKSFFFERFYGSRY
jgi:hypothetical protein